MFQPKIIKPARVWVCLFYPEDGDIFELIHKLETEIHCCAWISPLHAPEPTSDGMERKPHYHIELIFDGKQSFDRIKEICDFIGSKYPMVCTSKRGYARYLCHLDNPEKEQFDVNDVYQVGDESYLDCISSVADTLLLMGEICEFCYQFEVFEFWYIVLFAHNEGNLEWTRCLTSQPQFFKAFLSSMQYSYRCHGNLKQFMFDIDSDKEKLRQIREREKYIEDLKLARMSHQPIIPSNE